MMSDTTQANGAQDADAVASGEAGSDGTREAAAVAQAAAAGAGNVLSEAEAAALLEATGAGGIRPYDMCAHRINRMSLPNLEYVARGFALRATSALGALLDREVTVRFEALDRRKKADLLAALPNPAPLAVLRLAPLPELGLLTLDPKLLLALLDGFFGGTGKVSADPMAAASGAAQRFFGVLLKRLTAEFNAAWAPVSAVQMEVMKQEHDARFIQLGAADHAFLLVRFIAEFGGTTGSFDWLLSEAQLAPIREILAADGSAQRSREQPSWAPTLAQALQGAQVEMRAVLRSAEISLRELVMLAPGDVIPIEAPEQAVLMAEDVPLYHGRFGVSQGHNALKILHGAST